MGYFLHAGFWLALRKVYKPIAPIYYYMYTDAPDVQIGTYSDLWRKGRYRVELTAELSYDPVDVDAALQQLGYDIADADQWGRTYRHSQDHNRTVELDELEDQAEYIKLVLRNGDLDELDIDRAEDELGSLYARLYQMCQSQYEDDAYDPLYRSVDLESDQYRSSNIEQLQNGKLTYGIV